MDDIGQHLQLAGLVAGGAGSFSDQALEWNAFFSAVAQVSGGLVGLVFVALTFNGKLANGGDPALRDLARQTFADFLNVLVVSLTLLVPHTLAANVGLFSMVFGSIGALRIMRALLRVLKSGDPNAGKQLLQRFLLSMVGNIGLLIAGILLFIPENNGSAFWSTLFGSIIGLLRSGSRSAWMLVAPDRDGRSGDRLLNGPLSA